MSVSDVRRQAEMSLDKENVIKMIYNLTEGLDV